MKNEPYSDLSFLKENSLWVLVEDDDSQLRLIKNIIKDFFPLIVVKDFISPIEAFEFLSKENADLIIVDYYMEEMDGLAFIRKLRKRYLNEDKEDTRLPSFIMCTVAEDRKYLTEAFSLGVLDYVIKPFSPSELEHRIRRAAEFKEMSSRIAHLQKNSYKDKITGLWCAEALEKELERLYSLSSRYKMDYSILMIELDHVKEYLVENGENSFNDMLKILGDIIYQTIRSSDFAGRFSRSEIVIILPFTDEEGAKLLAWRILKRFMKKEVPFLHNFPYGYATFTAGLARKEKDEDILTVLRKADEAIYYGQKYNQKVVSFSELIND